MSTRNKFSRFSKKISVSDSQVSRDEKNEYYGSSLEKISSVVNYQLP